MSAARKIKAVNPSTMVVAYMNSIISYPWYRVARQLLKNSSWWLRDQNGTLLNNIVQNPTETWYTWDFSKPEVGELWAEGCLSMVRTGVVDGCLWTVARTPIRMATGSSCQARSHQTRTPRTQSTSRHGWRGCNSVCQACSCAAAAEAGSRASQRRRCRTGVCIARTMPVYGFRCYAALWMLGLCSRRTLPADRAIQKIPRSKRSLLRSSLPLGLAHSTCAGLERFQRRLVPVYDLPLGQPLGNASLTLMSVHTALRARYHCALRYNDKQWDHRVAKLDTNTASLSDSTAHFYGGVTHYVCSLLSAVPMYTGMSRKCAIVGHSMHDTTMLSSYMAL